jgi:hypothetical protein
MCKICDDKPNSHSFHKLAKQGKTQLFYSCPAEATKYYDTEGIVQHMCELLDENKENNWIWIFDGRGFGIKHSLQIGTCMGIISVLKKYGDTLEEIRMTNTNPYVKSIFKACHPFIPNTLYNKIKWKS